MSARTFRTGSPDRDAVPPLSRRERAWQALSLRFDKLTALSNVEGSKGGEAPFASERAKVSRHRQGPPIAVGPPRHTSNFSSRLAVM